ncbi:hypothetical protein SGFS_046310 [Streptomyces graminofaciens]|uniref:Small integral membrane protein n=1 Tax=Streptomyces graminofaciens TaxID=68212 RepID=A0ABM7FA49_9ACTN|nr:hypothetical protein [Streptomyces graminofaciens]BBC33337.1 hypothetical protein SGFS_046310 [Streptomyces graminofaciens]
MGDPIGETDELRAADNRLWQHCLHEGNVRYQQGNLFLVAQSLLAVAYSTILAAGNDNLPAARAMAAFGIAFTLIWLYTGHRHLKYSRALQRRATARFRDYAETLATCRPRGRSSLPLIAYALPSLAAVMWLVLLLIG